MTIGKLSRLFSSLAKPANNTDTVRAAKVAAFKQQPIAADAVKLNLSKATNVQAHSDASDPAKVAAIKKQVADGTYKVDSTKVANALINELGLV